jgi:hypothetical protein
MLIIRCSSPKMTKRAARAVIQVAQIGVPLTPGGYVILVMIMVAIGLTATSSTVPLSNELGRALRLSWWFS